MLSLVGRVLVVYLLQVHFDDVGKSVGILCGAVA